MNKAILSAVLGAALLATGCSNLQSNTASIRDLNDPSVSGHVLAEQVCSMCHGVGGNSINPTFPRLAGQQPAYLVEQLKAFRSHDRSDVAGYQYMWGIARSLTNKQIDELAQYYKGQIPVPGQAKNAGLVAQGDAIFHNGVEATGVPACASCHGPQGHGHDGFPRLASQHQDYLLKQLSVFKHTNDRYTGLGTMMSPVAYNLSGDQAREVAAYLSSQP
ncbi:MAG: c-type cytochrome [Betaproteobacteria bacterium]|nr:c-type cytochrome [Betaproteobacteria bacterium]